MAAYVISPILKTEFDQLADVVRKPKGTVLFRRGERGSGVFLVRKGRLALELEHANRIYPPRTLGPGSVAGLPAAVAGTAYSLTATVLEDSELGYIPRQRVVKLLGSNPDLCLLAMKSVSREIARMRSVFKFS